MIFLQISKLVIYEDKEMPPTAYREVPKLLHSNKCKELAFVNCNLSTEKLHEFGCDCSEIGMSVSELFSCCEYIILWSGAPRSCESISNNPRLNAFPNQGSLWPPLVSTIACRFRTVTIPKFCPPAFA